MGADRYGTQGLSRPTCLPTKAKSRQSPQFAWLARLLCVSLSPRTSFEIVIPLLPVGRLVGLVVKASASRAEDHGFDSRSRRDFFGSSHTSDLKNGTPVATLPGAWH